MVMNFRDLLAKDANLSDMSSTEEGMDFESQEATPQSMMQKFYNPETPEMGESTTMTSKGLVGSDDRAAEIISSPKPELSISVTKVSKVAEPEDEEMEEGY